MLSDKLCRNNLRIKLCREANELELKIALNKKLGLSYKAEEQELNKLYKKLRR